MPSARLPLQLTLVIAALRAVWLIGAYFLTDSVRRHHVESILIIGAAAAMLYFVVLPAAADTKPRGQVHWAAAMVASTVGALLLYWPVLTLGWLSDDWVLADRAARGEFISAAHEFVRPVPLLVWRALFALGGAAPATHALNLLLHAVNGAATVVLARELGASRQSAWFAGLAFLVWPTQIEAIAWASCIFDVLMTAAVLAVILLYTRWATCLTGPRVALILAAAALALASKETAVAIPALLVVTSAPRWRRVRPRVGELFTLIAISIACVLYLVWRVWFSPWAASAHVPAAIRYASKELVSRTFAGLAVPFDSETVVRYPVVVAVFASFFVVFSVTALVVAKERQRRHVLLAQSLMWCVASAAPAIGYLFIGSDLQGSRYLYLPAVGWAWFIGSITEFILFRGKARRWLQAAVVSALLACAAVQGRVLIGHWQTSAAMRDSLLRQAKEVAIGEGCGTLHLASVPTPYRGTQLFLNGFEQAVDTISLKERGRACVVRWDGALLQLTD